MGFPGFFHAVLSSLRTNGGQKKSARIIVFMTKNRILSGQGSAVFQADIHGNLLIRQRMQAVKALLEQEEVTVVTSVDGCMDFLMPLAHIREQLLSIQNDSVIEIDALKLRLVELGYERVGQVELPGQFSIRGGIVDIYCLTEENPWRIELWGDEVDSIRSFDAQSQRSLENLEEIRIYPAAEQAEGKGMVSFWNIFRKIRR